LSRASVDTFNQLEKDGVLSERRFQTLKALWLFEKDATEGLTHNEIAGHVNTLWKFPANYRHNVVARLCELEEIGLVRRVTEKKCTESGHLCTSWETVDTSNIKKIEKTVTATKVELIESLCGQVEQMCAFMNKNIDNIPEKWRAWIERSESVVLQCEKFRKKRSRDANEG
jgi:DNA-binding HxlR family transcriptional regulator